MNNFPPVTWSEEDGHHLSEDGLLLYVDGELADKEAASVQLHLKACWSCRVRAEKLQEAISAFIDYRNRVQTPMIELPPNGWRDFDQTLRRQVAEIGQRSRLSSMFDLSGRFFSRARPFALIKVAAGFLIATLIVALVLQSNRVLVVSASELLRKATEAQAAKLRGTAELVLYQRLRVRRTASALARAETANWETWDDPTSGRFRQAIEDSGSRRFLPAAGREAARAGQAAGLATPTVLVELAQLLRANHMDPRRPLSPASYQSWRDSIGQKHEEVTRTQLTNGSAALSLRTVPAGQVGVGQISEAAFGVRAQDWLPCSLRLKASAEEGDHIYEITEQASEVVNLAKLGPEIFAAPPSPVVMPEPSLSLSPSPMPLKNNPAPPAATAELEVEALRRLHQVGADLGEQISVARTPEGWLRITGLVETAQRESEILTALSPLASNPAVQIEILTVSEALERQQRSGKAAEAPAVTVQGVEIQSCAIAAGPDLRAYLMGEGKYTEEAINHFASRMVIGSRRAMQHLGAIKRLVGQFSPQELRALTPEAHAGWLELVRAHAVAYQQQSARLRRELKPVFFPNAAEGGETAGEAIASDADFARAVERLFELGAANDEVIRSAFTTSAGGPAVTALKTLQFWQAMKNAEALAEQIQSAKLTPRAINQSQRNH